MTSLAYRVAKPSDLEFVTKTFLDNFKTSPDAGWIAMSRWYEVMGREFADIVSRPGMTLVVAHHPTETTEELYGWIAVERDYKLVRRDGRRALVAADVPLVAYCFVKQDYRRNGIARGLMAAAGVADRWNFAAETSALFELRRAGKIPASARHLHLPLRFPPPSR